MGEDINLEAADKAALDFVRVCYREAAAKVFCPIDTMASHQKMLKSVMASAFSMGYAEGLKAAMTIVKREVSNG